MQTVVKTEYKIGCPKKIALVTDLHEHDPSSVLNLLLEEKPDIIAVAGDTLERFDLMNSLDIGDMSAMSRFLCTCIHGFDKVLKDVFKYEPKNVNSQNSYRFLREASAIAPVVMSLGNHEQFFFDEDNEVFEECNITLLDNDSACVEGIWFCGFSSVFDVSKYNDGFLQDFVNKDGYKVLLMHHPEYYDRFLGKEKNQIDLVMSGHCHGGQVRLFGHGLFAPGQGVWPRYYHGLYDGRLIVSSGTSNTAIIPRWGNPPEVVIIC